MQVFAILPNIISLTDKTYIMFLHGISSEIFIKKKPLRRRLQISEVINGVSAGFLPGSYPLISSSDLPMVSLPNTATTKATTANTPVSNAKI